MALLGTLSLLLVGCAEAEPEVPIVETPPLHQISDTVVWDDFVINSITPITAFESDKDRLLIYPYNNADNHIIIEKFYLSENYFLDTVLSTCSAENRQEVNNHSLFTLEDGTTHAFVVYEDVALHVYGAVPSGYISKVVEQL